MPGQGAPYQPHQAELAVANESGQDDTNTTGSDFRAFGLIQDGTSLPDPTINWIEERVIGGNREIFNKFEGQYTYEGGSVPVVPYDGLPIAYALGSETFNQDEDVDGTDTSGDATPVNTHVLTSLNNDLPPTQTIEATYIAPASSSANDFVRTFSGCTPASAEITANNENELVVTLDYLAMGVTEGDNQTASSTAPADRRPWLFQDVNSNLNLGFNGSAFARVQEFSLSITNNVEPGYYLEDTQAPDPFELMYGNVEYEMSATIVIDDDSIYTELIGPTDDGFQTQLEFQKPSDGNETLRITATECNFSEAPHEINRDEQFVTVDVSIIPNSLTIKVEDAQSTGGYLA